ncbi:HdeD family acid-resistance protein [Haloglycomyces albus]|uniref:HdeD family acid-resistance protein n=1 Tax=Haloglycomyces albus TaxID=526067 RepID=UPI00046CF097|nr:HdeD family acid-resistance protein [Haloglycomyces albus]
MFDLLTRNWGWILARGVLLVLFGLFALIWPDVTLLVLVVMFGAYALVDGIFAIVSGASGQGEGRGLLIFSGILGVLIGLMVFLWPESSALALLILIAVWAIIIGVAYIAKGISLTGDNGGRWLLILSGILGVVLGFLLMLRPGEGILAMLWLIGVFAILWGVVAIVSSIRLKKLRDTATISTT